MLSRIKKYLVLTIAVGIALVGSCNSTLANETESIRSSDTMIQNRSYTQDYKYIHVSNWITQKKNYWCGPDSVPLKHLNPVPPSQTDLANLIGSITLDMDSKRAAVVLRSYTANYSAMPKAIRSNYERFVR